MCAPRAAGSKLTQNVLTGPTLPSFTTEFIRLCAEDRQEEYRQEDWIALEVVAAVLVVHQRLEALDLSLGDAANPPLGGSPCAPSREACWHHRRV